VTDFLRSILPTSGRYCAVGIRGGVVHQTFHDSVEEIEAVADGHNSTGVDAYFALASFDDQGVRKVPNVQFLRALFLDIDCGPKKDYIDQADGAKALSAFLKATGLPTPTLVNSGGGLHVYWPLTRDVTVEEWKPMARSLKQLCGKQALHADPSVTTDAARILRVPGTNNFKNGQSRPVQIITQGQPVDLKTLQDLLPPPPVDLSAAKMFGMDATSRELAGDYPECSFKKLAKLSLKGNGCAQIDKALREAATLEEPLWRAALSIATRCSDRVIAIHKLSSPHPDYEPSTTEDKAAETKGPYLCSWYKENYGATCEGCKQTCSTPLMLGKTVSEAPTTEEGEYVIAAPEDDEHVSLEINVPSYGYPYFRGATGGVFKKVKAADGETETEIEIYRDDLYLTERFYDSDTNGDGEGEMVGINLHMRKDGLRRFYSSVKDIMKPDTLRDLLVRNGVITYGKHTQELMAYFASSLRRLQSQYAANRTRHQMGWTPDKLGFVVGDLEYTASGTKLAPPASGTRQMAAAFKPTGTLEEWKTIANFYDRVGLEAHAFTLFCGFGSPLLKVLNHPIVKGVLVHLYNAESGAGKSTAQMVANSIFGSAGELLIRPIDTGASKNHLVGMLNSIVATIDEISNDTPEMVSAMAYGVTDGRGKNRMNAQSNTLRQNTTTWCNITITSSNSSVIDMLMQNKNMSDGELRRVLQLDVPIYMGATKEEIDSVFSKLTTNYGVAGPIYIDYIIQNMDKVTQMLADMQKKVDREFKLDQRDRFYSCLLTVAFTGALIAQRLGLHDIDIKRIYQYMQVEIAQRKLVHSTDVSDPVAVARETLAQFIHANINNALVAPYTPAGGLPQRPAMMPKGDLKMRYDPESHELAIPVSEFRKFFASRSVDVKRAVINLTKLNYMKHEGKSHPTRLGAGALGSMSGIAVRCYIFDGAAIGIESTAFNEDQAL
jgi:uncharacterized protein (DUF927 family)